MNSPAAHRRPLGQILISEGIDMVAFTRMIGIVSNSLPEVPLWAAQAFVPLGAVLLLLVALAQLLVYLAGFEPRGLDSDSLDQLAAQAMATG